MFRINHNVASLMAQRHLSVTDKETNRAVERLSSGLRIVRAADDAAGLFVSEQMRAQIAGLQQADRNAQNAISMLQTAEGGMEQISSMLIRIQALAIEAADSTYPDSARVAIQREVDVILQEFDRIADSTTFNGISLMQGTAFTFQVGETGQSYSRFGVTIGPVTTGVMIPGVNSADFGNQASAINVVASVVLGIASVAEVRTQVGAAQNRLERTVVAIRTKMENVQNAESVIRDADFAAETAALTRALILVQSGTSVLSQVNLLPQNALPLMQF